MSRILVTGATGYVGRQCLTPLRELGFEVHGLARQVPPAGDGVTWHGGDVLDASALRSLLAGIEPTHLLHLAWTTAHGAFWSDPANEVWLDAARKLIDDAAASGVRRIVTVGSCAEYDWQAPAPFSETTTPCEPATLYGQAKLALCAYAMEQSRSTGISHAHGRLFFSYGPGEQAARLVPAAILSLAAGREFAVKEADALRDYLDVREIGRALALIAASDGAGPVNIGLGQGIAVGTIVSEIARLLDRRSLVRLQSSGTANAIVADATRLHAATGFQNQVPLAKGLAFAIDWWRQRGFRA